MKSQSLTLQQQLEVAAHAEAAWSAAHKAGLTPGEAMQAAIAARKAKVNELKRANRKEAR